MLQPIAIVWRATMLVLLSVLLATPARAQREYFNWYFGDSAGVTFVAPVPRPTPLLNGKVRFPMGVASMSDAAGRFAFATDGLTVWDRNGQPMPGRNVSQRFRSYGENGRHVLALPQPGSSSRYYVFVSQREFYTNEYPVGASISRLFLPYVVVDMNARNGLGGIVARDSLELPRWALHARVPYYGLTGNWAAVRHANNQDLWLVGMTSEGQYVSWLLTASGLAAEPVVSLSARLVGTYGILKAAPHGRQLAALFFASNAQLQQSYGRLELTSFDPATGQVSGPQEIRTRAEDLEGTVPWIKGLEYSPDGSRLYVDLSKPQPFQYDLLAGSAAAIDASRTAIAPVAASPEQRRVMDMQLGPDGKIYLAYHGGLLGCINAPNVLGNGCQLRMDQVDLRPRQHNFGTLPLAPNDLNLPPVVVNGAGSISSLEGSGCMSEPVTFLSSLSPFVTAAAYAWDFGDPESGLLNTAAGQSPVHLYERAGTYTVTLRVTARDGRQFSTFASITIADCTNIPNIITPNGDGRNDAFVLGGLRAADWSCRLFSRWGRLVFEAASYQNDWRAAGQPDGVYYYQLIHRQTGKVIKGTVEVAR